MSFQRGIDDERQLLDNPQEMEYQDLEPGTPRRISPPNVILPDVIPVTSSGGREAIPGLYSRSPESIQAANHARTLRNIRILRWLTGYYTPSEGLSTTLICGSQRNRPPIRVTPEEMISQYVDFPFGQYDAPSSNRVVRRRQFRNITRRVQNVRETPAEHNDRSQDEQEPPRHRRRTGQSEESQQQ